MANNNQVYEIINGIIVKCLNDGICPWRKPWQVNGKSLYISRSGNPYSFLNTMLLIAQGAKAGEFITLKQANAEGGKVKKGAKSYIITFYKQLICKVEDKNNNNAEITEDEENEPKIKKIPMLKYYRVFNIADCENIQPKHNTDITPAEVQPIDAAEQMLKEYLSSENAPKFFAEVSNDAFYRPSTDEIHVPAPEQFNNPAEYYSTAAHECIHSTGHKSRLDRLTNEVFGSVNYSREELVAEIGAATLLAQCGIEDADTMKNSVAYLQGWAKHLTDKPKEFAVAAARAEHAVNWILGERVKVKDNKPKVTTEAA